MKESYLFLAEGFEEVEALTAVDILRRGEIDVKTVSITRSLQVGGAHGIIVTADLLFDDTNFDNASWLILPGGLPGASNLYEYAPLQSLIRQHLSNVDGRVAAICAAPALVLGQMGLLKGNKATCYPGFEKYCEGATMENAPVVVTPKFVLGNGPANAMKWALEIVSQSVDASVAENVANGLLTQYTPIQ
jgi:4-methyl-5(b-hydroxyethyl)-thiazole monophosphate biosynthesis